MGILYIVATPIGNLKDASQRCIETLSLVDVILAEDTRVTARLLQAYEIKDKSLIAYHQHSNDEAISRIYALLKEDKNLALVTDAGTPGIQDPGSYLISRLLELGPELKICPIPGPSAVVSALSVSGFSTDSFLFLGFPPHKKGRKTFFEKIGSTEEVVVIYESKFRIMKALSELKSIARIGDRKIMVAREITKQFETIYRGTVDEVIEKLNNDKILGEFVVVIQNK